MNLKLWYGLGLAGLLGLVGVGSASLGGMEPMTSPLPEGGTRLNSPPTPELQTFSAGGHVLGFAPRYLLTASGHHGLKVEFLNAQPVIPQSDTPAATSQESPSPPLTQVRYPNLWDGIDLSYHAAPNGIAESLYRLQPGADINQVRLRYNRPLNLTADGRLSIRFDTGVLSESAPVAWQEVDGQRLSVSVSFVQHGERELGFTLGEHDPSRPLWIDPTLSWNTFLGGSGGDVGSSMAMDNSSNLYVTGSSFATWGNPLRTHSGGSDAFIAKLAPNGALLWNTFLGGRFYDWGLDIALDGSNNLYVIGSSERDGWGNPLRAHSGGSDVFIAKLDANGVLLWNTFLGGNDPLSVFPDDFGGGIAVNGSGNLYVTGSSYSSWGSPLRAHSGDNCWSFHCIDAFVTKLDTNGTLLWNTFLGGDDYDAGWEVAVDANDNVYVTGDSLATWGNPLRLHSGSYDAFVAKLNANGALLWNTFLGGSDIDTGHGLAVDGSGSIYLTGSSGSTYSTGSSDANWGSPVRALTGDGLTDVFAAKLDPSGALLWNTFLGGKGVDRYGAIALDGGGHVYVTGYSPFTWGSPLRAHSGDNCFAPYCGDGFIAQLDPDGALLWNLFLGGSGYGASDDDENSGIVVDGRGNLYVSGYSTATWGNPILGFAGGTCSGYAGTSYTFPCPDAFVAKLGLLTQIDLSGIVSLSGADIPVCALVLANGRSQFSCDGEGHFALKSVPIDSHDQVTLYAWADGFDPYQLVFTPTAAAEEVDVAMSVSPCQGPSGGTTTQHSSLPRVDLSGQVSLAGGDTPVCALVLANGQSQFSCGGDGHYVLDGVPTDSNGQVTLFAWAEGFFPYKAVFAPFSIAETRDVPMTVAVCED